MAFLKKLAPPTYTAVVCCSHIACGSSTGLPSATASFVPPRLFHSVSPLPFKYKIKIKDPDQNQMTTPIDYDSVHFPGQSTPDPRRRQEVGEDEEEAGVTPNRERDQVYQRNLRRKMSYHVDPKTRARTMKSWPVVTMGINALKDHDLPQGIRFNVAYHDTHAYERHSGPTVLILHGLQLPSANFSPLVEPLLEQGYRVIAPVFPSIGHNLFWPFKPNHNLLTTSKDLNMFSHSTIERGIFASDFVEAILPRGRKIDVVIAADIASYSAVWLMSNSNFARSLVLLDAFPATPIPKMKPFVLFTLMSKISEMRFHHFFSWPFMAYVMAGVFGSNSFKEASAHMRQVGFADFPLVDGGLTSVEMRSTPAVVYASKRNKFVPTKDARELMRRLGIEDRHVEDLSEAILSTCSSSSSSASSSSAPSPTSSEPSTSPKMFFNDSVFQTTLTHSCGRFFEPKDQDEFGKYNRRYAKADWYHLAGPIATDVAQLIKRIGSS